MKRLINDKYPVKSIETASFNFLILKIACLGVLGVYISEMINRIIFFTPELELPGLVWRITDSAVYALSLILMGFQVLVWLKALRTYENQKKAKYTFIALMVGGILTALYEVLLLLMPEQYSQQSDYSVPFLLMIIIHFLAIIYLKNIIEKIGRSKKVKTGRSLAYSLFALNPAIRYLLPFILLIGIANPTMIILYSELIMTYLTAFITAAFVLLVFLDARKIKRGHLLDIYKKTKKIEEEGEEQDFTSS